MTLNVAEDQGMRLSTIPNRVFWPVWSLSLAGIVSAFAYGIRQPNAVMRGVFIGGYIVGLVVLVFTAVARQRVRTPRRTSPAARRFVLRFLPAMGVYVIALLFAIWLNLSHKPAGLVAYLVALAPALPILVAIWATARFMIEQDDEFERRVMVESFMWATGATLALATVIGFLQAFELVPAVPLWTVFPALAIFLVPAQGWVRWKYR